MQEQGRDRIGKEERERPKLFSTRCADAREYVRQTLTEWGMRPGEPLAEAQGNLEAFIKSGMEDAAREVRKGLKHFFVFVFSWSLQGSAPMHMPSMLLPATSGPTVPSEEQHSFSAAHPCPVQVRSEARQCFRLYCRLWPDRESTLRGEVSTPPC